MESVFASYLLFCLLLPSDCWFFLGVFLNKQVLEKKHLQFNNNHFSCHFSVAVKRPGAPDDPFVLSHPVRGLCVAAIRERKVCFCQRGRNNRTQHIESKQIDKCHSGALTPTHRMFIQMCVCVHMCVCTWSFWQSASLSVIDPPECLGIQSVIVYKLSSDVTCLYVADVLVSLFL